MAEAWGMRRAWRLKHDRHGNLRRRKVILAWFRDQTGRTKNAATFIAPHSSRAARRALLRWIREARAESRRRLGVPASPLKRQKKMRLRKAKARWRRKREYDEKAEALLRSWLDEDSVWTRRGRSAFRGLFRRGYTKEKILPLLRGVGEW